MFPSKILIIITGSIAVAKSTFLISALAKKGCEVQVVCTQNALKFIGPATLEGLTGNKVHSDLYDEGQMMGHIHLVRWADAIIVAPATANFLNKMAQGLGDDLASTLMLAHQFDKPVLVAPAMNTAMYLHPTTQNSLKIISTWGFEILKPSSGVLACGEDGPGRLLEPELILNALENYFVKKPITNLENKKILITAGGTVEPIDGVRVITNLSTGKTGLELAQYYQKNGSSVTFIHAKSLIDPTIFSKKIAFQTYNDLALTLKNELSNNSYDAIIHLAAVSDFSIDKIIINEKEYSADEQLKLSSASDISIRFKNNPKIISQFKSWSLNPKLKIVGFKLTKNLNPNEVEEKIEKLFQSSHCDYVVHNDLNNIHKESGTHQYTIYSNSKTVLEKGSTVFEMFGSLVKGCKI